MICGDRNTVGDLSRPQGCEGKLSINAETVVSPATGIGANRLLGMSREDTRGTKVEPTCHSGQDKQGPGRQNVSSTQDARQPCMTLTEPAVAPRVFSGMRRLLLFATMLATTACASAPAVGTPAASTTDPTAPPIAARWPVKSLPHLDLWIHAFAMVANDSALVPLYQRGYRDSVTVVKNRLNLLTSLDANRESLEKGLRANPGYLQAQFFAFEFLDWDHMRLSIERFLQAQGDPQRARDQATAQHVALWASVFRTSVDREWLRLFFTGVTDEATRFYIDQRAQAFRERHLVVTAIDSMWHGKYMSLFERFLSNSGQRNGDLILSMPLGGEGRASTGRDGRALIAVAFPARETDAPDAMIVFAHEVVGSIVGSVVADHTTPAEKRDGAADRMVSAGQVRAGAILVQRVAPDLLPRYVAYYLREADKGAGSAIDALERAFPLPTAVTDGLRRQIDVVLGGI